MSTIIRGSDNFDTAPSKLGKVLQVVTTNSTVTGSTTSYASLPTSTTGLEIASIVFTPVSSTSKILVTTSDIAVSESSNVINDLFVGAWADTDLIGINTQTVDSAVFTGALNFIYRTLNHSIQSWGTYQKTISIRAGSTGAGTMYVNYNPYRNALGNTSIGITIYEIGA